MNTGPEIISLSNQTHYIGIVKSIARIEGESVTDKLGNTLRPFEILFNVGDIISGARAVPLALSSEVNVGDPVLIYSMDSIYNNTFLYQPLRNLSSPKDTIKLKYNNAVIEFKPDGDSEADLLLSAGNNLVAINSTEGTITLDTLNGVRINGGSHVIDIRNDSQTMHDLMERFIDTLTRLQVIVPDGTGMIAPTTVNELLLISSQFDELLGDVDATDAYPVVPDDTYTEEFVEDVVRETGLDILTDDHEYKKGEDPVIDGLRKKMVGDESYPPDTNPTGTESTTPVGNTAPIPVDCYAGEIKNNTKLSNRFTVADLSIRTTFPHTLRAQVGLSIQEIACNLKALAVNIIEPLKTQYPNLKINSAFRSTSSLQGKVSQHQKGEAVDIQIPGISPAQYMPVAEWIKANLPFDQLIFEHGNSIWLHISHKRDGAQRKSLLTMYRGKYTPGLRLHY